MVDRGSQCGVVRGVEGHYRGLPGGKVVRGGKEVGKR